MKVTRAVGYITGQKGTGVIYEVETESGFVLATIYDDNTFHPISLASVNEHIAAGKAAFTTDVKSGYRELPDQVLQIENPQGWARLYTPGTGQPNQPEQPETGDDDSIEIPYKIELSGVLKMQIGGLSAIFNILG